MAATDYSSTVYARLWALLEGHTPFTDSVAEGNRIKFTADEADPTKGTWNDADFPECTIFPPQISDTNWSQHRGYGQTRTYNVSTAPAVAMGMSYTYPLVIVHRDWRWGVAGLLVHETLTAIRKGGPALGLNIDPGNLTVDPISVNTTLLGESETEKRGGIRRLVSTFQIKVNLQLRSSQLLT